jgi:hypothetical protein
VQIAGEDLGVTGLVHRLCRGVVLGVDPGHRLDQLGRGHHGALFAVHELAELSLEQLHTQLAELFLTEAGQRRARQGGGDPGKAQGGDLVGHNPLGIDVGSPVQVGHTVPLGRGRLVVEVHKLGPLTVVAPAKKAIGMVVHDPDLLQRLVAAGGRSSNVLDGAHLLRRRLNPFSVLWSHHGSSLRI